MSSYTSGLAPNASPQELQEEINFIQILMETTDTQSPTYEQDMAEHQRNMSHLVAQLNRQREQSFSNFANGAYETPSSPSPFLSSRSGASTTASSPGRSSQNGRKRHRSTNANIYDYDRKRLWNANTPASLGTITATTPYQQYQAPRSSDTTLPTPNTRRTEIIDLTQDEDVEINFNPSASMGFGRINGSAAWTGHNSFSTTYSSTRTPGRSAYNDPFGDLDSAYTRIQTNNGPTFGQYNRSINSIGNPQARAMDRNELAGFLNSTDAWNYHPPQRLTLPPWLTTVGTQLMPSTPNYMQPPSAFPLTYSGEGPPTQDSTEALSKLLENIRPDEDIPKELREPTPKVMSSILMEHQKIGLAWLKRMEKSVNKGGILADDMGLGKTIQALALMLARPSEDPARKTTLIVAPLALMKQWAKEIEAHVKPEHRLNVYIYHGPGKNKEFTQLRTYDVVLTTYGTLASQWKKKQGALENDTWLSVQKKMPLVANGSHWYRVILDEAQCIKNRDANCSKAAHELHAQYRLCMTGTPMMNNIDELFPLVRFLRIKPYHEWKMFSFDISKPIKETRGDLSQRGIERVQALLKGIMLRRTKDSELDGKPIIVIPAKHTKPEDVVLSKDERELYAALETKSQLRFNRYLEKGTVNNNYASILLLLLRLRQACCHPFLIRDLGVQASTEGIAEGILLERAQELGKDTAVVNRLKVEDGFECPICFDATDNPTIFIPCGHNTCGECFQKLIEGVPDGDDNSNAKCPECRAVVSSKRITDYAHFLKVYCPERLSESERDREVAEESDSNSELESESEEEDDGLDGFIVPDDVEDDVNAPTPPRDERQDKGKRKGKGKNPSKPKKTLAELKKESLRNKAAKRRYLRRLRRNWVTSAKIEKTLELLDTIYVNDPTEKTLIFSQFTSFLDLLEVPMQDRNIPYQRYDGSMNATDRADAVADFMENCNTRVLLVSLKAGNAGLNLNKASQVIMLDPFWNPFVEDQAVDRAHRMRQEREVHVHRILAPETVEDRICALQDRKRELITTALDPKAGNSIARLGVKDLMFLFGGRR